MGFDSFFFSRVDHDDKTNRIANKTLEMVWQGSASLKNESDIFTSVFWGDYYAPKGFCFDPTCNDPEINVSRTCYIQLWIWLTVTKDPILVGWFSLQQCEWESCSVYWSRQNSGKGRFALKDSWAFTLTANRKTWSTFYVQYFTFVCRYQTQF